MEQQGRAETQGSKWITITMPFGTILGVWYRCGVRWSTDRLSSIEREGLPMRVAWGVLFLGFFISAGSSLAQTIGASLQGTVYDPSGAFVPGATIEIRNVEKGGTRTLTTDDHGRYREPLLPPGEYELRMR